MASESVACISKLTYVSEFQNFKFFAEDYRRVISSGSDDKFSGRDYAEAAGFLRIKSQH